MNKFDAVLFDFDGTIADTSPGIKEGLRHTFELNNMPVLGDKEMDKFIGPPLNESFAKFCNVSDEKAREMMFQFRAHYHTKAIDKFVIYEGLESVLKLLKERGFVVGVATSKPEVMARYILEKADLLKYFDVVRGASLDGSLMKKTDILTNVLKNEALDGKNVLMVGDTDFDILGAHQNNIPCLWVEYGFGTKEDAIKANAEYMVNTTEDMREFFKLL